MLVILAAVSAVVAQFSLTFTGNADVDFPASQINVTSTANFNAGKYQIYVLFDGIDVGAPPSWPYVVNGAVSGWDMKDIRFQYDYKNDDMHVAIDSYGCEGDADNDGDPGHTSPELAAKGGVDIPNFGSSESCAILLDIGAAGTAVPDGTFDWAIGYPGSAPSDSDRYPNGGPNAFPQGTTCAMAFDTSCFGLYLADQQNLQDNLGARFLYKASDPTLALARSMNLAVDHNVPTTKTKPHLEWSLVSQNALRTAGGFGTIDQSGVTPFDIGLAVFCGSFQDDGIGEDFFPNQGTSAILHFPCQVFDACDVCGGNGKSCADCAGVPNGPNKYDACDVCGGNGSTCKDCNGVANGPATYDVCDVCNGNGQSCRDCKGVPGGTSKYDVCNVCGGDGTSCLDCRGLPNGTNKYDVCDVCAGNNKECLDCTGTPFGTKKYDVCGVCGGDGTSCDDCKGVPNGTNKYDVCDVCAGNGQSCLDCAKVPFGTKRYDVCDVCGGNGQSCLDCKGVPFGTLQYDNCGVCGGDGTECAPVFTPLDLCARRTFDRCELFPGDEFEGVYPDSGNEDLSGQKFTVTVAQDGYLIFASTHSTLFSQGIVTDDRQSIALQDLYSQPLQHSCLHEKETDAQYTLSWNDTHCRVLTLTKQFDGCQYRKNLWSKSLTLLKKPCRGPADGICSIQERTVWTGKSEDHGGRSWFVFGGNNAYVETHIAASGARTSYFGRVAVNNKREHGSEHSGDESSSSSSAPRGARSSDWDSSSTGGAWDREGLWRSERESSEEHTWSRTIVAFTEFAASGASPACALAQSTGFYHARGLELTDSTLTEGTFEPLHGVYDHSQRIKFARGRHSSDTLVEKSASETTYDPLNHVHEGDRRVAHKDVAVDDDDDDEQTASWLRSKHRIHHVGHVALSALEVSANAEPRPLELSPLEAFADDDDDDDDKRKRKRAVASSSSSSSSSSSDDVEVLSAATGVVFVANGDDSSSSDDSVDIHVGSESSSSGSSSESGSERSDDASSHDDRYDGHVRSAVGSERAEEWGVGSAYHGRSYRRSDAKDNCGIVTLWGQHYDQDACDARRARLAGMTFVAVDSCRGGVPPECTCNPASDDASEWCVAADTLGTPREEKRKDHSGDHHSGDHHSGDHHSGGHHSGGHHEHEDSDRHSRRHHRRHHDGGDDDDHSPVESIGGGSDSTNSFSDPLPAPPLPPPAPSDVDVPEVSVAESDGESDDDDSHHHHRGHHERRHHHSDRRHHGHSDHSESS